MAKKKRKKFVEMSSSQLINHFGGTKSAAIRGLAAKGFTRSQTANMLGILYQHVRNVLITPLKKAVAVPVAKIKTKSKAKPKVKKFEPSVPVKATVPASATAEVSS